jgi:hypothetical protein
MLSPKTTGLFIAACAAGSALVVFAQQPKELTARELFYSASTSPRPPRPSGAPVPNPPPKKSPPPQVANNTPPPSTPTPNRPAVTPPPVAPPVTSAPVINAAEKKTAPPPTAGPALGLRYTVLKMSGNQMVEVPTTAKFRAGDKIQLRVEANIPGYLYIIAQGSSGIWKPMFPSPEVEDGNNRVEGWRTYTMPPKSVMTFDEQKGTEKVFIILSREPEADLEKMIYSLQGGAPAKPAATPEAPVPPRQMVQYARANIDDATVGRLRQVYSRDLIIEKVDPNTPGDRKETAVYVVNPTGSNSSRVVADLSLVHE